MKNLLGVIICSFLVRPLYQIFFIRTKFYPHARFSMGAYTYLGAIATSSLDDRFFEIHGRITSPGIEQQLFLPEDQRYFGSLQR